MKKGVSLIVLIATVVILSILISTVTISGIATVNNANKLSFATEISLIQESVDSYMSKNNGELPISNAVQLDISGVTPESSEQFSGETKVGNKITLNEIDYTKLGLTNLKFGLQVEGSEDVYVMSQDTKRVYYAQGLIVGNKTYYTLTEDLKLMIDYKTPENTIATKHGVIFIPSETDWTNEDVTVIVKIPKVYLEPTVTATGSTINVIDTANVDYNVYEVIKSGNYEVIAQYKIKSTDPASISKFEVTNVDEDPPTLSLDKDNQKLLVASNPEETYAYFKILEKSDALSGVKVLKYTNDKITTSEQVETYFKTGGKIVYNDIIKIDPNVEYITVYLEDKAGNWTSEVVTIDEDVKAGLLSP